MSATGLDILRNAASERWKVIAWRGGLGLFIALLAYSLTLLDWSNVAPSWLFLLQGLGRSWLLAVIAIAIGAVAAIPLAVARIHGPPGIRQIAVAFIEIIRATPELMIIFWVYFTLPLVTGSQITSWQAGIGSLSVIAAAYLAEIIRAGINSIPRGQTEAGISTGLGRYQIFRYVILPQALRNMLPALIAQLVGLFKTTSLVYAIGVMEFFRSINVTNNAIFAPYPLYATLALGYFLSCFAITRTVRWFDPKYRIVE